MTVKPTSLRFQGYLLASVGALASDMVITLVAAQWLSNLAAASLGFTSGTLVSYLLAKRLAMAPSSQGRTLKSSEFVQYASIGIMLLGVCAGTIHALTDGLGFSLFLAKLISIPATFVLGFVLRRKLFQKTTDRTLSA